MDIRDRICHEAFLVAGGLAVLGMLMPPMGDIRANVLIAVAQFLLLVATLLGVERCFKEMVELLTKEARK